MVLAPLLRVYLRLRVRWGKEDPSRIGERMGESVAARPNGRLIWFHGASVGECQSALPLIQKILAAYPDISILLTSGTKASAEFMWPHLSPRLIHQYVPLDHPKWVERFLMHWQPELGIWVESELWPNLISQSHAMGIELILLNARMSEKSFIQWQKMPGFIHYLLARFSLVLAQSETYGRFFSALGANPVEISGNIKFAAPPLSYDLQELQKWQAVLGERKIWLAASTHEGEEKSIAKTHSALRREYPDLLTVIAPRHPPRSAKIQTELRSMGLSLAVRSQNQMPSDTTDIYLADTIGELGLFFALCPVVFIGGSYAAQGGHNLLEPARFGCAILYGPNMQNFRELNDVMQHHAAAQIVRNDVELLGFASRLLSDNDLRDAMGARAKKIASGEDQILDEVLLRLSAWLGKTPQKNREKRYANA